MILLPPYISWVSIHKQDIKLMGSTITCAQTGKPFSSIQATPTPVKLKWYNSEGYDYTLKVIWSLGHFVKQHEFITRLLVWKIKYVIVKKYLMWSERLHHQIWIVGGGRVDMWAVVFFLISSAKKKRILVPIETNINLKWVAHKYLLTLTLKQWYIDAYLRNFGNATFLE